MALSGMLIFGFYWVLWSTSDEDEYRLGSDQIWSKMEPQRYPNVSRQAGKSSTAEGSGCAWSTVSGALHFLWIWFAFSLEFEARLLR